MTAIKARTIFVQIKCHLGTSYEVAARILDTVQPVAEIFSTSGQYDLLAKFRLAEGQDPGLFVTTVLQKVEGVADTYTIIGFNAFTPESDPA
jgi:DNA-binding Lrp family transcriptional regulator